jgi:pilus assembly protein Flp/PilA
MTWLFKRLLSMVDDLPISFMVEDAGATAIEYGLIAALIAVVIIGVLSSTGTNLSAVFSSVANALGSN